VRWRFGRSRLTAQEILTVKSDDVVGRVKTYESIVKGQNIPQPGIPESFKVLVKELQALALDVKVLDKDNNEIDLKQNFDDEMDVSAMTNEDMSYVNDASLDDGYVTDEEAEKELGEDAFNEYITGDDDAFDDGEFNDDEF